MNQRSSEYPVVPLIINRWSPRALSGESITQKQLMTLFEAARWAPSSYNNQPWRFIYAKRDTPAWQTFFNLLVDANKVWAKNAAILIVILSAKKTAKGHVIRTHSFDTGSAWQNLALQATSMGLVAHGMEGFDYEKAKEDLSIPDGYAIEAMCAVGKPGDVHQLPKELQERETPSSRKPVESFIFEGKFTI